MFSPSVISRPLRSLKASMVISAPLDVQSSLKVSMETSDLLSPLSSQASNDELSPSSSQASNEELSPEIPGREFVREIVKSDLPPEKRKKRKKGRRSIFSRSTSDFDL